jgi:hypothetical protein
MISGGRRLLIASAVRTADEVRYAAYEVDRVLAARLQAPG